MWKRGIFPRGKSHVDMNCFNQVDLPQSRNIDSAMNIYNTIKLSKPFLQRSQLVKRMCILELCLINPHQHSPPKKKKNSSMCAIFMLLFFYLTQTVYFLFVASMFLFF